MCCHQLVRIPFFMKVRIGLQGTAAWLWFTCIAGVIAQPEQWLQYRTTAEPQGYRWTELTNKPPPGVVWPKLGPNAQYGKWTTKLDPKGGRWICLDRTARSGLCDRLFIDCNGNGRLDDETPVKAARREEYMSSFDPVKLVFKGEDGPITYHLLCTYYQFSPDRVQLLTGSGCVYEGKVNFGGKKHLLQIVDSTVNGLFNDISSNPSDSDRVLIDGQEGTSRYLGRLLEVDNRLFRIEVSPDGAFVKAEPARNLVQGVVRLPENIAEFTAVGLNGHFVRRPVKGEVSLPEGVYRVHGWRIDRKDDAGRIWHLTGSSFSDFATFSVSKAQPVSLAAGEPVKTVLQATRNKGEFSFSLQLQGSLGESVDITCGTDRAPAPQLQLASAKGTYRTSNNFQYG
jgi:hypothetical protein